ncbi:putative serine/threonine kinase-like protein [Leptotrombidium deliense]|uniref:Putative serine/threonine kinase-like protein n=1 Tax=Leptotrombidium deliense TaxID=299467 RepID=A0A443SGJ6_9ACAR|nr:putative serine/threonine kinase-like protein [Leptotrombidium deliense]
MPKAEKVTTFTNVVCTVAETELKAQIEMVDKSLTQSQNNRKTLQEDMRKEVGPKWQKFVGEVSKCPGPDVVQWEEVIEEKGFKADRSLSLGNGKFGAAYQGKSKCGKDIAIKMVSFKTFQTSHGIKDWDRQMKILLSFKHPKLNSIIKAFTVANTSKIYFITIFAPKRSVQYIVDSTKRPIQTELAKMWTRDIAEAVAYLHSNGIAHRKINPRKVLVKDMSTNAKLAVPEGFVDLFNPQEPNTPAFKKAHKAIESPYSAYEALFGGSYDASCADIWSIGAVLYFMLTKKAPFVYTRKQDKMKEEINKQRWQFAGTSDKGPKLDKDAKGFLAEIFQMEPSQRPTAVELVTRPYLQFGDIPA